MKLRNELTLFALASVVLFGACAALQVTPKDRQLIYEAEGKSDLALCKAYHFDLSLGLTHEAPSMTKLCAASEGAK